MKSNLNIKSILIIALIGVLSFVFFSKSFAANTAKVNVDIANIRKSADADATIVEQAAQGEDVEILEKSGDWYKVKYNNVEGYIKADLIDAPQEQATETAVQEPTTKTSNENVTKDSKEESKKTNTTEQEKTEVITGKYNCRQDTTLRIMPIIYAKSMKDVKANTQLNVLEVNNKWAYVEVEGRRGWILVSKLEKLREEEAAEEDKQEEQESTEEKQEQQEKEVIMYVNSEIVNLRKEENTSSESIAKLTNGTQVTVYSEHNGWSKVKVDGKEGYISSALLSDRKPETTTSRSLEEERQLQEQTQVQENGASKVEQTASEPVATETQTENSGLGEQVCNYARQFLGCPYVWGGTSPNGFDCSGFTQYVYSNFGVALNRTSDAQASNGTPVDKSNLQAGDLLIFSGHVGIYLGDGTFIHAANSNSGVIITSLYESYYVNSYITARRIFN